MKLTSQEKNSPLWAKIKEHYDEELTKLRQKNDGDIIKLSEIETAELRGQIRQVKMLLALEKEPKPLEADPWAGKL